MAHGHQRHAGYSPIEHTAASGGQPLALPQGSSLWQTFTKYCFFSASLWLPSTASQFCSGSVSQSKENAAPSSPRRWGVSWLSHAIAEGDQAEARQGLSSATGTETGR